MGGQIKKWSKKRTLAANRYFVNKFFANLETRGAIVNGKAILFCYNKEAPELSYILVEHL